MPRYVAFLRAINVGGHTVRMDRLRELFVAMGFSDVETLIASGNVIFRAASEPIELEQRIEEQLGQALGFDVATFIRDARLLPAIASLAPFAATLPEHEACPLSIAFLKAAPGTEAAARLDALHNEIDHFHIHDREVYWLRRFRPGDSKFSGAVLEKTLGMPATFRNVTTVRKLADRYAGSE
ncbi:DUF1697 domain-containing protein [soil metagenome]